MTQSNRWAGARKWMSYLKNHIITADMTGEKLSIEVKTIFVPGCKYVGHFNMEVCGDLSGANLKQHLVELQFLPSGAPFKASVIKGEKVTPYIVVIKWGNSLSRLKTDFFVPGCKHVSFICEVGIDLPLESLKGCLEKLTFFTLYVSLMFHAQRLALGLRWAERRSSLILLTLLKYEPPQIQIRVSWVKLPLQELSWLASVMTLSFILPFSIALAFLTR